MKNLLIMIAVVLVSCNTGQANLPEPEVNVPPQPIETISPTASKPTQTAEPAPTATEDYGLTFNYTIHHNRDNPGLDDGDNGEWDAAYRYAPYVVPFEGKFYMYYVGMPAAQLGASHSIGVAISDDALNWEAYDGNPLFYSADHGGREYVVTSPLVVQTEEGSWVMFLMRSKGGTLNGNRLMRLTADHPLGPWTLEPDLAYQAATTDWNDNMVIRSLTYTGDGFRLWFDGKEDSRPEGGIFVGFLETVDGGLTFSPYNDPDTDERGYENADPVFSPQEDAFDAYGVASPIVFKTDAGYEMFYLAIEGIGGGIHSADRGNVLIGYATSPDGITWERYPGNPVIRIPGEDGFPYMSAIKIGDTYYIYFALRAGGDGIGVITLEIER